MQPCPCQGACAVTGKYHACLQTACRLYLPHAVVMPAAVQDLSLQGSSRKCKGPQGFVMGYIDTAMCVDTVPALSQYTRCAITEAVGSSHSLIEQNACDGKAPNSDTAAGIIPACCLLTSSWHAAHFPVFSRNSLKWVVLPCCWNYLLLED